MKNIGKFKNEKEWLKAVKNAINYRKQKNIIEKIVKGNWINLIENKKDCIKYFQIRIKLVKGNEVYFKGYQKPFTLNGNKLIRGKQIFTIQDISKNKF